MSNTSLLNLTIEEENKIKQQPVPNNGESLLDLTRSYDQQLKQEAGVNTSASQDNGRGLFGNIMAGAANQFAGVTKGLGEFANAYLGGTGDAIVKASDAVMDATQRDRFYNLEDMIPGRGYYTDPSGLAYDSSGLLGSMGALTAAKGIISSYLKSKGIYSQAIADHLISMTPVTTAALLYKLMPGISKDGGMAGETLAKIGELVAETTGPELMSEMGGAYGEAKEKGMSEEEARKVGLVTGATEVPLLALTNTLEGKLLAEGGKGAKNAVKNILLGSALQGYEEGGQAGAQDYAMNADATIANVFSPYHWSDEAKLEAAVGALGSLPFGGAVEGARNLSERERFINAIGGQESGGDYGAVNERTEASGKYQITPDSWKEWAQEVGLPADAPMTPENQEIVARFKLGEYYDKYGARGAAMAWYGGEGSLDYSDEALNRKQGKGDEPSINEYADSVLSRMGSAADVNAELDVGSARELLTDWYQNESLPGAERSEVAELLENGSDEGVIAKAIELQQRENQATAEETAKEANESGEGVPESEGTAAESAEQQKAAVQQGEQPKVTAMKAAGKKTAAAAASAAKKNEAVTAETPGSALNKVAKQAEVASKPQKAAPVQNQGEAEIKAPQGVSKPISGMIKDAPALEVESKRYADDLRRKLDDVWRRGDYNKAPLSDDIKQRIEQAVNDYDLPKMLEIRKELKMPLKGVRILKNYVQMYKAEEEQPLKKAPAAAAQAKLPTNATPVNDQLGAAPQAVKQDAAPREQKAAVKKTAVTKATAAAPSAEKISAKQEVEPEKSSEAPAKQAEELKVKAEGKVSKTERREVVEKAEKEKPAESPQKAAEKAESVKEEQDGTEQAERKESDEQNKKKDEMVPSDIATDDLLQAVAEETAGANSIFANALASVLAAQEEGKKPKKKKTKKQLAKEKEDAELAEAVAAEERQETLTSASNKEETLDNKLDALISRAGMNNKTKSDMRKNREGIIKMAQESGIQLYKDDSTQRPQYYLSSDVNGGEPRKISKTTAEAVSYLTGNLIKPITEDIKKAANAAKKTSKQTLRDVIPADERDWGFGNFLYEKYPKLSEEPKIFALQDKLAEPSAVDPSKTWYDVCEEAAFRDLQLGDTVTYDRQIFPRKDESLETYYWYLHDKFDDKVHRVTRKTPQEIADELKISLSDSLHKILKTDDDKKVTAIRDKVIAYMQEQNKQIDPDNVQEVKRLLVEIAKQSKKNVAESTPKAQKNVTDTGKQKNEQSSLESLKYTDPRAYEELVRDLNDVNEKLLSIKGKNSQQLDRFNPTLMSQLLKAGKTMLDANLPRDICDKIFQSRFPQAAERLKRMSEFLWQFLNKLPRGIKFNVDEARQTLQVVLGLFGKPRKLIEIFKQNIPKGHPILDYLEAGLHAIKYYPRQKQDTVVDSKQEQVNGGNADVNVGVAGLSERSGDSRGNGNQVAGSSESQVGKGAQSGEAGNQEKNIKSGLSGRADSENVSGAGTAAGRTQSNQQGGGQVSGNQERSSGIADNQRSAGNVQTGGSRRDGQRVSNLKVHTSSSSSNGILRDGSRKGLQHPRLSEYKGKVKEGDAENVRATLSSYLYDAQCGDVVKAEKRLFNDNGKGMLIANGTGTGKTRSGLGVVARQWMQGRRNILVVVPTQEIGDGWINEGERCGFDAEDFAQIKTRSHEKEHINIITYNSLYQNPSLLKSDWDLVVCDESHHLVAKENGTEDNPTKAVAALRAITGHERGFDGWMHMKYPEEYKAVDKADKELAKIGRELNQADDLIFDTDLTHLARTGGDKYEVLARNRKNGKKLAVEVPIDQKLMLALQGARNADMVNSLFISAYTNSKLKARQEAFKRMREANAKITELERREAPVYEKRRTQVKNGKVLFLSATPFSYDENLYMAEGYLFNYADVGGSYYNMLQDYFGFEPNANGVLKPKFDGQGKFKWRSPNSENEINFHNMLIDSGAMSKRRLEIEGVDYNRKFIKVKAGIMDEIDKGFDALSVNPNAQSSGLFEYMDKRFSYAASSKLLESIKADAAIPLIKKAIANGEQVVLFHDTKKDSDLVHPFKLDKEEFKELTPEQQSVYNDFIKTEAGKKAVAFDAGKLKSVPQIMKEAFGEDTLLINGDEVSEGVREVFNREGDYKKYMEAHKDNPYYGKLVVCTTAKAKEGLSLHDKVGDSPRVLINVGLPVRPTDLIQLEGRIYRFGQKSNAKFRYLTTGTASEGRMFMNRINNRSKAAENFALGNEARILDWALTEAYMQAEVGEEVNESNIDAFEDNENAGGKASDMRSEEELFKSINKLTAQKEAMKSHIQASVKERMARTEAAREEELRRRILSPDNEIGFLQQLKDSLKIDKPVTKVSDGVYIATLPTGRTLWFDLNTSQAEILARMSESDKARYLKNAGLDGGSREFEIAGYLSKDEARSEIGGNKVDVIHLTEAAKTHTLDHEIMHFVHNALLTTEEKSWLQRYFFYQMKKRMGDIAFNKLPLGDKLARAEEMEAEMYEAFCAEDVKPRNALEKIFYRMKLWLAEFANNMGLHTPFGVYAATRSGKIFNRYGNGSFNRDAQLSAAAAMYRNKADNIADFIDRVENKGAKKTYFEYAVDDDNVVTIDDDALKHIQNEHHLTVNQWQDVLDNLDRINEAYYGHSEIQQKGKPIAIKITTPQAKYGMVLEFADNGRVFLKTLYKGTDKSIDASIKKRGAAVLGAPNGGHGSSSFRMSEDKPPISNSQPLLESTAAVLGAPDGVHGLSSDRKSEDKPPISDSQALSISIIKEALGIVNKYRHQPNNRRARNPDDAVIADALSSVVQQEEQADGTVKYSIKPIETADGKRMPDDSTANEDEVNSRLVDRAQNLVNSLLKREGKEPKVKVVLDTKDMTAGKVSGLIDELMSPSRIKTETFKVFHKIYSKAYEVQERERNFAHKAMNKALGFVKNAEEKEQLSQILMQGDLEGKEWTSKELREDGVSENVIKGYTTVRALMNTMWKKVNDAHRGLKTYRSKMTGEKLKKKAKEFAIENMLVRLPVETDYHKLDPKNIVDTMTYEVRYDKPKVYKSTGERITEDELRKLQADPNVRVTKLVQVKYATGETKRYEATIERTAADIGKIEGYIPHIFHHWVVFMETEKGLRPIVDDASAKTPAEARKKAEAYLKANPDIDPDTLSIRPLLFSAKSFDMNDPIGGKLGTVAMTDAQFIKATHELENQFSLSYREASKMVGTIGRRTSRNRFLGNLQHREGVKGYEADPFVALERYITVSTRYIAMQPAKSEAIPLYERTFGQAFDQDPKDTMASFVKRYIKDCNGEPGFLEKKLSGMLNSSRWYRENIAANYGDRAAIALSSSVNSFIAKGKLGWYNVSTGLVNLMQLSNTLALVGPESVAKGVQAYLKPSIRDKRVLLETGVLNNMDQSAGAGYSKMREAFTGYQGKVEGLSDMIKVVRFGYSKMSDAGMSLFQMSEQICRRVSVLSAYDKAIKDGKTHAQAIAYAKEVNRKANFDYGVADSPAVMRAASGTVVGDLVILFQKYPIKEFEFMVDMVTKNTTAAQKARFWGTYFLMSGLFGLPGMDSLDEFLEKLFGYKPSIYAKAFVFKNFGDNAGTRALLYGMSAAVGVDVSRRLGLQDFGTGDSLSLFSLGVFGDTFRQVSSALASGEYLNALKAYSPAFGNAIDACRGYKTNSKGQIVTNYTASERAARALGFRPVRESITSDMQSFMYMDKKHSREEKTRLTQQMARKVLTGEKFSEDEIQQAGKLGIKPKSVQDAARKMSMTAKERMVAGLDKRQRAEYRDLPIMQDEDEEEEE